MSQSPAVGATPEISVVVPTYRSEATIGRCLSQLERQTYGDYELIVVDSSPDNACARVISAFRMVRLERSPVRLSPQAARRLGARLARGRILVFTDPETYSPPQWLERMAAALARHPVVNGGLVCRGRRWLDRGIHLCKESEWLPARRGRWVAVGTSLNLALPRELFEKLEGTSGGLEPVPGDERLSWRLAEAGQPVWLEPTAWIEHHHRQSLRAFLSECFRRGQEVTRKRLERHGGEPTQALRGALLMPFRLVANLFHVARHAFGAGQLMTFFWTSPLIAAGFAASLVGEARQYGDSLQAVKLHDSVSP